MDADGRLDGFRVASFCNMADPDDELAGALPFISPALAERSEDCLDRWGDAGPAECGHGACACGSLLRVERSDGCLDS